MSQLFIDKSLLNLFTILISGAGIFAILIKYNVPQLNASFWSENPYAIKREIIENVLTRIFILLALVGLLIQAYSIIYGDVISVRLHNTSFYIKALIGGIIMMMIIVSGIGSVGKSIAKNKWFPIIIESQTEIFKSSGEIIHNNGFLDRQLTNMDNYSESELISIPKNNYERANEHITQIEDLLEVIIPYKALKEKHSYLSKYFNKKDS